MQIGWWVAPQTQHRGQRSLTAMLPYFLFGRGINLDLSRLCGRVVVPSCPACVGIGIPWVRAQVAETMAAAAAAVVVVADEVRARQRI